VLAAPPVAGRDVLKALVKNLTHLHRLWAFKTSSNQRRAIVGGRWEPRTVGRSRPEGRGNPRGSLHTVMSGVFRDADFRHGGRAERV